MIEQKIINLNETPFHDELDAIVTLLEGWTKTNNLKNFEILINNEEDTARVFVD